MTEAEWLACDDPAAMLPLLKEKGTGRVPVLFSAACLRRASSSRRSATSRVRACCAASTDTCP